MAVAVTGNYKYEGGGAEVFIKYRSSTRRRSTLHMEFAQ
jgi:hypothetical protein